MKTISSCLFLLLVVVFTSNSTPFELTEYTIKDGLESNTVTCIYQDRFGFIWIGTIDGLNRFDGTNMYSYRSNLFDTTTINNNRITAIQEDGRDNLWIATQSGINRYNRKSNSFERYILKQLQCNPDQEIGVRDLLLDCRDNLWLCTSCGLSKLIPASNGRITFKTYFPPGAVKDTIKKSEWSFLSIHEDQSNRIWTGSWGGGLMRFDPGTESFEVYKNNLNSNNPNSSHSISSNIVTSICELEENRLLVGTYDKGLNMFNTETGMFLNYDNTNNLKSILNSAGHILTLHKTRKGTLIMGTTKGTFFIKDWTKNGFGTGANNFNSFSKTLKNEYVSSILEDNGENLWVGTNQKLIKISPYKDLFSEYRVSFSNQEKKDYITDFVKKTDGTLLLSTYDDGIIHCSPNGEIIKRYLYPEIVSNNLNTLHVDDAGNIWCGGISGVSVMADNTGFVNLDIPFGDNRKNGLNQIVVSDIETCKNGFVWVVTQYGLDVFNPRASAKVYYPLLDSINLAYFQGIFKDNEGNMLVYGVGGVYLINPGVDEITRIKQNKTRFLEGLCHNHVKSCVQDSLGRYWFGTTGGITIFDPGQNYYQHFFESEGLASHVVTDLISLNNQIWIKTESAITVYDLKSNHFTNYFESNGLEHMGGCIWTDGSKSVYVAGEGNFTRFDPNGIETIQNISPIYFTDLWINGKKIIPEKNGVIESDMLYTNHITLNHHHQVLTFNFVALNYYSGNKNSFKYLLEGYDTKWYPLGEQNELTLMNLDPGEYVLHVNSANSNNTWSKTPAKIKISVLSPWWKSPGAYVMYTIVFLLLSAGIVLLIIRRERYVAAKKRAKEISQMKIRFFTDISHELRTPITLISNPVEHLIQNDLPAHEVKSRLTLVHKNVQRVLKLINQLLDIRELDAGKYQIQPDHVELFSFIKNLIDTFAYEAQNKHLTIEFTTHVTKLLVEIDKRVIERITTNLLSNAIKYSPHHSTININLNYKEHLHLKNTNKRNDGSGDLVLSVSDNGQGIPDEEKKHIFNRFYQLGKNETDQVGSGIGLNLVQEMTRLYKGEVEIKDNLPQGSVFIVSLPGIKRIDKKVQASNSTLLYNFIEQKGSTGIIMNEKGVNNSTRELILWVEDNQEMREYVSDILEKNGYRVKEAVNGKEAFKIAQDTLPDLVLTDIMMPVEDGIMLCKNIKNSMLTSHIPVILLSAKAGSHHVVEGLKHKADDYITKPFNADILLSRIKNLMDIRNSLKKIYRQRFLITNTSLKKTGFGDEEFLTKIKNEIELNLENSDFNVDALVDKIGFSRAQLSRKLKVLVNLSPHDLIKQVKMEKAKEILMANKDVSISEISYKLGFKNLSHFSRTFKEYFNQSPRECLNQD